MKLQSALVMLLLSAMAASVVAAEAVSNWPRWRGPQDTGSITQGAYPTQLNPDAATWSVELPGRGCSTPIVWDGRIYLTAPSDGKDALIALDDAGKRLWTAEFGQENPGKHRNGSGCNPSPVTDGEQIFVNYKSGTLAAVTLEGEIRWQTNLVERYGPDTLFWDHGSSPVLTEKYVVATRMHKGESWVAAFDKQTGELVWKVARNYDTPVECDHGYSTPLVVRHNGVEALMVWGAEHLTLHAADSGEVIWTCGEFNPDDNKLWPAIATPVLVDNMAVVAYGRNDRGIPRLHGIRVQGEGDMTTKARLWKRDDIGTFVPSPVTANGKVYLVGDKGLVTCLDPKTGETVWTDAFPKNRAHFYASPLIAGGRLYAPREDGVVYVADISSGFKLLTENDMGESIIASPTPLKNGLLIRGAEHLFYFAP